MENGDDLHVMCKMTKINQKMRGFGHCNSKSCTFLPSSSSLSVFQTAEEQKYKTEIVEVQRDGEKKGYLLSMKKTMNDNNFIH